jgi:hypothetical protein
MHMHTAARYKNGESKNINYSPAAFANPLEALGIYIDAELPTH